MPRFIDVIDYLRYWLAPLPRPPFKVVFWGTILGCLLWHYFLKRPIYQKLYGVPDSTPLEIVEEDIFTPLADQPLIVTKVNGYDIEIQPIKYFKTTARIVYVDRYNALGSWYRSNEAAKLYDTIVPQDISLASGNSGRYPECFKFDHEYRLLSKQFSDYSNPSPQCAATYTNVAKETSNNHSIAASVNVQKGLDILKVGDIAQIEAYAVHWNGTGKLSNVRFEGAITLGEVSKRIVGGQKADLCRQLLITKITFDGYTFE